MLERVLGRGDSPKHSCHAEGLQRRPGFAPWWSCAVSDMGCAARLFRKKERKIFVTDFNTLGLSTSVLKALSSYSTPTPIQAQAIPQLLAGRDLLGIAQTGTGKTAAFTLPILDRLAAKGGRAEPGTCRTLILSPTRELCAQIGEAIRDYGRFCRLSVATVYGGVSISAQLRAVKPGVDIVVATPGRLVDLVERRALSLSKVGIFVLDE